MVFSRMKTKINRGGVQIAATIDSVPVATAFAAAIYNAVKGCGILNSTSVSDPPLQCMSNVLGTLF